MTSAHAEHTHHANSNGCTRHHDVIIIGTGFGGIASAYYLERNGFDDFVFLERADDVGGVWRDNQYPGCACDVQSHLYSFSFAPNPDWSHHFSAQPDILAYLREVVRDFGWEERLHLNHDVERLDWDERAALWRVSTNQGEFTARHVVGAFGSLSEPAIPDLPGLAGFEGQVFHSATWPEDFDPKGKHVAVVGTGASAIQFVPAIQPDIAKMHLFQRSPPWVMPRHDGEIGSRRRELYARLPLLQRVKRFLLYAARELMAFGFRHPSIMRLVQKGAIKHLHKAVKDPALRKKLTPDYTLGCKRILLSNTYYPALAADNVEVVDQGLKQVTAKGVVDADGNTRPVDTIIFGTGFKTDEPPYARLVHDSQGRSLADVWNDSPKAYMGTTVHGFPNLYLLHGPNIGLGHTSVIYMMEAQAEHIVSVLRMAREKDAPIVEPTADAQEKFLETVEKQMRGTVWTAGGCTSWYLDKTGRNSQLWPGYTFDFRQRAAKARTSDYRTRQPAQEAS